MDKNYVDMPGAGRMETCYERLADDKQGGLERKSSVDLVNAMEINSKYK